MKTSKYISTFELEEARLGQAMQATSLKLSPLIYREVLSMVRNDSINIEYALETVAQSLQSREDIDVLLKWFKNKKTNV